MEGNSETARFLQALRGELPEVILGRIFHGDPLCLQALVMRVLRCNGFLIDPDRCMQQSLEEIAFLLSGLDESEDDPEHAILDVVWIERCVDRACDQILAEDIEAERIWNLGVTTNLGVHRYLSEAFGVTWGQGRSASVAFHNLSLRARLSFFAVCVDRMPAARWLAQCGVAPAELRDDIWDVFCALGYVSEHEVDEFRQRG